MEISQEELNFFRFCNIAFNIIPDTLRQVFKHEWYLRYGLWDDSVSARNLLASKIGEKTCVPTHLSYETWDCTALFQAVNRLTLPDVGDNAKEKRLAIDKLQRLRCKLFHSTDIEVDEVTFAKYMDDTVQAFQTLGVKRDAFVGLTKSNFSTKEVGILKEAVSKESPAHHCYEKKAKELEMAQDELDAQLEISRQSWLCGECKDKLTKFHKLWKCKNQHSTCDNCVMDHLWNTKRNTCPHQNCTEPIHLVPPSETTKELVYVFVDNWRKKTSADRLDVGEVLDYVLKGKEVAMLTLFGAEPPESDTVWVKAKLHKWTLFTTKSTGTYFVSDIVKVVSDKGAKRGKIVIVNGDPYMIPAIKIGCAKKWPFEIWMFTRTNPTEFNNLKRDSEDLLKILNLEELEFPYLATHLL